MSVVADGTGRESTRVVGDGDNGWMAVAGAGGCVCCRARAGAMQPRPRPQPLVHK